jgi:predicted nucleic acid-binding protein
MPDVRKRIYWDAPVWLAYINGDPDRLPIIDGMMADSASDKGNCKLHTSVLSEIEVAFGESEQNNHILDPSIEDKINQLWSDSFLLVMLDFHELIGREARGLMRQALVNGWSLKPMDALHLSTAKFHELDEFHTYDEHLQKYSQLIEMPIVKPHIGQLTLLPNPSV